jgi:hypothetical protein
VDVEKRRGELEAAQAGRAHFNGQRQLVRRLEDGKRQQFVFGNADINKRWGC